MKPFDLMAALRGEPCVTRCGAKVEIVEVDVGDDFPLRGIIDEDYSREEDESWTLGGCFGHNESPYDLVGMWQDPPPKRTFGDLEWQAPLSEGGGHLEPYYWA